jgi:putative ABC transport system permease protein
MIIHLFKLIINKRRQHFFLLLQLFISFLALFLFFGLNIKKFSNYFKPLGWEFNKAWLVTVDLKNVPAEKREEYTALVKRQVQAVKEVKAVSEPDFIPFHQRGIDQKVVNNGQSLDVIEMQVDEAFKEVLNIKMLSGKWKLDHNSTSPSRKVVITRSLAESSFGNRSPLGKTIDLLDKAGNRRVIARFVIVGVVDNFRVNSSADETPGYFINTTKSPAEERVSFVLKSENADRFQLMEDKIRKSISKLDLNVEIEQNLPLSFVKKYAHKTDYIQLAVAFIVFIFLIINVFVGVTGVFTYNFSRRRSEIGLRMAMGATSAAIRRQLLGETLVLTSVGIFPGVLIAAQLLITHYFEPYMTTSFGIASLLISATFLYLLMLSCAIYPSFKASGIQPAEALHED